MADERFRENSVILTGASSGMGRELALLLAESGAWLTLASRDAVRLEGVASECRSRGGKAIAVETDVGDEPQCGRLIERAVDEYGRIDTLVNNAGYGLRSPFEKLPELGGFRKLMEVNFMGAVSCTYFALPYIKKSKGRIVGVSSVLGKIGTYGNAAYSASKFGMQGFFDCIRLEVFEDGVSVTMIYPGLIRTEFGERMEYPDGQRVGEEGRRMYSDKTMTADAAAKHMFNAIADRKRDLVITKEGRIAVWIAKHFPKLMDVLAMKFQKARAKKLMETEGEG